MKALLTTGHGPTDLRLADIDEPSPREDEAVVEVRAVSVNRGELAHAERLPPGSRLGWDVAGVVVRAADDGSGPAAGTRVVGVAPSTGWAERVAVPTRALASLPEEVRDTEAAALPVAGLTAYHSLRKAGWLLGSTLLVTGAGGGVGRFLVQLAARGGARVIAVVGSAERAVGLGELGASVVTTYDDVPDELPDLVVDGVGGQILAAAMDRLKPDGVAVAYGNASGQPLTLPADWGHRHPDTVFRRFSLLLEASRTPMAPTLAFLIQLLASGLLDPQVAATAPWGEAKPLLEDLLHRRVNGKVVLTVGS